ncbi:MAG TPA: hypothetical protein VGP15_03360 [Burkholderiales bacterium]|nr:hypothetical protein [Burkholderiales bacterium]
MEILSRILRIFRRHDPYNVTSLVLDHIPLNSSADWRKQKLVEAAQRHGKPFKCAGDDMPREVLVDAQEVKAVGPGENPTERTNTITRMSVRRRT